MDKNTTTVASAARGKPDASQPAAATGTNPSAPSIAPTIPPPARRPLRVFAFDPSAGKRLGNEMQIEIRYRQLAPGPVDMSGARDQIAVVDYNASLDKYYQPVDLDDPFILIPNGLAPTECDPRFHQQMVYAVASETIERFENALGRRIGWRRAERELKAKRGWRPDDILTLTLYPHAMSQANAFYSPDAHGILFGYFQASQTNAGQNLPGQTVFTCLSHDIIAHEVTHAILDGIRSHFMEQTNLDVAAFHEAFADLSALFLHYTHREVLSDTIKRSGGRLYTPALKGDPLSDRAKEAGLADGADFNPLIELATQFGQATGLSSGLRSAIESPKTLSQLHATAECHERGSILVAAVFEAFFDVYIARAARLFRIYRSAGGTDRVDLPDPLADALCDEATRTAQEFFQMCVRALDYLPPVDVTFGDFLRAVLTSHTDYDHKDQDSVRDAWMQSFRRRQILPLDASFFSEGGLRYPEMQEGLDVQGLLYGGPLGLTPDEQHQTAAALTKFISANMETLELDPGLPFELPSFHPVYRVSVEGSIRWDLVVEVVQTRPAADANSYAIRGGTTLIISTHSTGGGGTQGKTFVRYAISKPIAGPDGTERTRRVTDFLGEQGVALGTDPSQLRINFALVHASGR